MKITGKAILGEWNRRRSVFNSHGTELIAVHSYCAPVRMLINVFSIGDTAKCHYLPSFTEVPFLKHRKAMPRAGLLLCRIQLLFIWLQAQAHCKSHYGFVVPEAKRKKESKNAWESHYGTSWALPRGLRCSHPLRACASCMRSWPQLLAGALELLMLCEAGVVLSRVKCLSEVNSLLQV